MDMESLIAAIAEAQGLSQREVIRRGVLLYARLTGHISPSGVGVEVSPKLMAVFGLEVLFLLERSLPLLGAYSKSTTVEEEKDALKLARGLRAAMFSSRDKGDV